MSKNGEIYTAGKNFTLSPAVTALTNSASVKMGHKTEATNKVTNKEDSMDLQKAECHEE